MLVAFKTVAPMRKHINIPIRPSRKKKNEGINYSTHVLDRVLRGMEDSDFFGAKQKHEESMALGRKLWETPRRESAEAASLFERTFTLAEGTTIKEFLKSARQMGNPELQRPLPNAGTGDPEAVLEM